MITGEGPANLLFRFILSEGLNRERAAASFFGGGGPSRLLQSDDVQVSEGF